MTNEPIHIRYLKGFYFSFIAWNEAIVTAPRGTKNKGDIFHIVLRSATGVVSATLPDNGHISFRPRGLNKEWLLAQLEEKFGNTKKYDLKDLAEVFFAIGRHWEGYRIRERVRRRK